MPDYITAAFEAIITDPIVEGENRIVSLYLVHQFYGGPEEGGWWGNDYVLEQWVECATEADAAKIYERIQTLAESLSKDAKTAWGEHCQREVDNANSRGIDPADLPETDGPDEYVVMIEARAGENNKRGDRHYS